MACIRLQKISIEFLHLCQYFVISVGRYPYILRIRNSKEKNCFSVTAIVQHWWRFVFVIQMFYHSFVLFISLKTRWWCMLWLMFFFFFNLNSFWFPSLAKTFLISTRVFFPAMFAAALAELFLSLSLSLACINADICWFV